MATSPFEIMTGPLEVYIAAVATAFPAIEANPSASWTKLGTNGNKNQGDDGVKVSHPQTVSEFFVAGTTAPVKAHRTQESLEVQFTLHDLTLELYARLLNNKTVTDVAASGGAAGYRHIPLLRGQEVTEHALLVRGSKSAYGNSWNTQFELYKVYVASEPAPVFDKGTPAGLLFTFRALYDFTNSDIGRLVMQDAAA